MRLFILLIYLPIAFNAQAQRSITRSFGGLGINPTSGFKTITENGKILTGSSKDLKQKIDTTIKKITFEKTAIIDVKPIFLLADSILVLQKIVLPNPSSCGGYGLQKVTYNVDNDSILLFCSPNFSAYENLSKQIKKEKRKVIRQQMLVKLKNAKNLLAMYQKLSLLINNVN